MRIYLRDFLTAVFLIEKPFDNNKEKME